MWRRGQIADGNNFRASQKNIFSNEYKIYTFYILFSSHIQRKNLIFIKTVTNYRHSTQFLNNKTQYKKQIQINDIN